MDEFEEFEKKASERMDEFEEFEEKASERMDDFEEKTSERVGEFEAQLKRTNSVLANEKKNSKCIST